MKASKILSLTFCALLSVSAFGADEKQNQDAWKIPADKEKFHVFILMGQSNMSGFGAMTAEDRQPVAGVVKLPTVGEMKWQPAAHPLHNRLPSDRFGLGLPFAVEYMKKNPGVVVGLIPLAWGGAPIDGMKKGSAIYTDAMKKAKFAMSQGTIKGVLWHQGESDTVAQKQTDAYEQKLHQLIADIRKDLGNERLPFIVGNLAEFYGDSKEHSAPDRVKRIDAVRGILRALPQKVPFTGFVESTDCTSADKYMVHFDRKSYIILGTRYAEVFDKVVNDKKTGPREKN